MGNRRLLRDQKGACPEFTSPGLILHQPEETDLLRFGSSISLVPLQPSSYQHQLPAYEHLLSTIFHQLSNFVFSSCIVRSSLFRPVSAPSVHKFTISNNHLCDFSIVRVSFSLQNGSAQTVQIEKSQDLDFQFIPQDAHRSLLFW